MTQNSILIIAGYTPSLINFRGHLLHEFISRGFEVYAIAPQDDSTTVAKLTELRVKFIQVNLKTTGLNPFFDFQSILSLYKIIRRIRPNIVFSYTIKPVIYGSIAGRIAKIPNVYSLITGLGSSFNTETKKQKWIGFIAQSLYKFALKTNSTVFFQNPDDQNLFIEKGLIKKNQNNKVINGSGVDLKYFNFRAHKNKDSFSFLLIGRLLKDKGIREFADAARIVKTKYPKIQFNLLGYYYDSPNKLTKSEIQEWVDEGIINYLGEADDVRPALENCTVYVLPSYREGTPRSVLEAMAIGRPIITTDVPGCRETVIDGENGLLVPSKNVEALAKAMLTLYSNPDLVLQMGSRSRKIAEERYDVHKVNKSILKAMNI